MTATANPCAKCTEKRGAILRLSETILKLETELKSKSEILKIERERRIKAEAGLAQLNQMNKVLRHE